MKIAVDIRPLFEKHHSGVQEYLKNLLINILSIDKENQYILFSSGQSDTISDSDIMETIKNSNNVKRKHLYIPNKILNRLLQLKLYPLDNFLENSDVFFLPNISYFYFKKTKVIVTFHDLSFEYFPEFYSWDREFFHLATRPKDIAQKANKIIAVSHSTKQDLIDLYGIEPKKIFVIYSGIKNDLLTFKSQHQTLNKFQILNSKFKILPKEFILFLGTIEPRKNIENIIKSFEMLKDYDNLYLVIAGPKGWKCEKVLATKERSFKKNKIIFFGPVLPYERFYLYKMAKIFVWPSYFEGFGFPPLEAMSAGVPTIISHTSSLPEAVSSGAILINPYKPEEIFLALNQILKDKKLQNYLSQKGKMIVEKFSWHKTALKTLRLLTSK